MEYQTAINENWTRLTSQGLENPQSFSMDPPTTKNDDKRTSWTRLTIQGLREPRSLYIKTIKMDPPQKTVPQKTY